MEKTSTFQKIKYVNGWQGKEQMLWFHEVTMANGDSGKLDANTEEKPSWLTIGNAVNYTASFRQGKGMYIKVLAVGSGMQHEPTATPFVQPQLPLNRNPERQESKKSFGRLDDDENYWMARQKCISLTTCLERANDLVINGKIELKEKESNALSDFKFIMKHSGLEALVQAPATSLPPKTESYVPSNKRAVDIQPVLFEDVEPIPEFILIGLSRCDTIKQLTNFKSQLLPEEISRKKIIDAVYAKETEIKSKKK